MRAKAAFFIAAAGFVIGQGAAQSISYSRQIAPILAMNCHNCHGANPESAAGGLSTRTYADLRRGGNLGPVIAPGNPEQSALLQFVNGARGEAHRMPLGGPPLSGAQIAVIRQWILEGAAEDAHVTDKYRLELPSINLDRAKPVRISCRLPSAGYLELELSDSRGHTLYMDGGAVKEVRDVASIGVAGEWMNWNLRRAADWPAQARVRLTVSHASSEPVNALLAASENSGAGPECPEGEADVHVFSMPGNRRVFRSHEQVPSGMHYIPRGMNALAPGLYVLHLRYERTRCQMAVLIRAGSR